MCYFLCSLYYLFDSGLFTLVCYNSDFDKFVSFSSVFTDEFILLARFIFNSFDCEKGKKQLQSSKVKTGLICCFAFRVFLTSSILKDTDRNSLCLRNEINYHLMVLLVSLPGITFDHRDSDSYFIQRPV